MKICNLLSNTKLKSNKTNKDRFLYHLKNYSKLEKFIKNQQNLLQRIIIKSNEIKCTVSTSSGRLFPVSLGISPVQHFPQKPPTPKPFNSNQVGGISVVVSDSTL